MVAIGSSARLSGALVWAGDGHFSHAIAVLCVSCGGPHESVHFTVAYWTLCSRMGNLEVFLRLSVATFPVRLHSRPASLPPGCFTLFVACWRLVRARDPVGAILKDHPCFRLVEAAIWNPSIVGSNWCHPLRSKWQLRRDRSDFAGIENGVNRDTSLHCLRAWMSNADAPICHRRR